MFITKCDFRAFDRDHEVYYVSESPLMEKALTTRIRRDYINTAFLKRVVRYEAVDLKQIQADEYDMCGKRITPNLEESKPV